MAQSKFGKLNLRDALHGFVVAFLTASLTGLYQTLNIGHLPNWEAVKMHALMGLTAGIGYLIKQFLQNDEGKLLKKSNDDSLVGGRPDDRKP